MKNKTKETSPQGRSEGWLKLNRTLSKTAPYKNGPGHKEQTYHYLYIERIEVEISQSFFPYVNHSGDISNKGNNFHVKVKQPCM